MKSARLNVKTGKVEIVDVEFVPEPEPTREEQERNRLTAYRAEADPLFFKWQAGEATEQEWLDARNAVRERYPYPE